MGNNRNILLNNVLNDLIGSRRWGEKGSI